jgi:FecR protein
MPQENTVFRLSRQGLMLAMISTAFAGTTLANTAARVDFAIGAVTATGKDGQARTLTKGADVLSGDRIVTTNGRAQLRFTDGAFVSLQPNTTFEVREYRFDGKTDGTEKGFFGLLRGAMRTVTGLIGRVNRSAYQIQTPTATVGIRGTGGIIEVLADTTTRVTGDSGTWFINKPNQDTLDVPAGTIGEASPDPDEPPRETTEQLVLTPPQPIEVAGSSALPPDAGAATFIAGDQVGPNGFPLSLTSAGGSQPVPPVPPVPPTPPMSLDGYFDAAGFTTQESASIVQGPFLVGAEAKFDPPNLSDPFNPVPSQGKMVEFATPSFASPTEQYKLLGTQSENGAAFEPGTVDKLIVSWGRWIGNVDYTPSTGSTTTINFPSQGGLHYVVGLPTLPTQIPSGATFTYNLAGATAPTDGISSPGTFTGTLVGDFINAKVGVQGMATVGGVAYSFQTTGFTPTGPQTNGIPLNVTATSNNFAQTGLGPVTFTGGCASGCSTDVSGAFYGASASHAGIAYRINSFGTAEVTGAAAFAK